MEEPIVLFLVLVLVAIIVLPIAAIVTANSRTNQLRGEVADLVSRIRYLEARLENLAQRAATSAEAPNAGPAETTRSAPVLAASVQPPAVPAPIVEAPRSPEDTLPPFPPPAAGRAPVAAAALQFRALN